MKPAIYVGVTMLVAVPSCLRAALEFWGFMSDARALRFMIADPEIGRRSEWLTVGQSFQGYTIVEFERASETLVLRHDEGIIRLPLRVARTRNVEPQHSLAAIDIMVDGQSWMSVRNEPDLLAVLRTELQRIAIASSQARITLVTPEDAAYGFVVQVMNVCKEVGLKRVTITSNGPTSRQSQRPQPSRRVQLKGN